MLWMKSRLDLEEVENTSGSMSLKVSHCELLAAMVTGCMYRGVS